MYQLLNELFGLPAPQLLAASVLPVLFAITLHEVSHGWVAKRLGDPTAQRLGRLSLNPIKHIDPVGTVLVPISLLFLTSGRFVFGWAKPVPVTWENLRNPKRDMVVVAAAGPIANFMMALFWGLLTKIGLSVDAQLNWISGPMVYMGAAGVFANILLMVFNLFPLPPLDGGRVAVGLLPGRWSWALSRVEPYGFFILIGLMLTGLLQYIIFTPLNWMIGLVGFLVGIPLVP